MRRVLFLSIFLSAAAQGEPQVTLTSYEALAPAGNGCYLIVSRQEVKEWGHKYNWIGDCKNELATGPGVIETSRFMTEEGFRRVERKILKEGKPDFGDNKFEIHQYTHVKGKYTYWSLTSAGNDVRSSDHVPVSGSQIPSWASHVLTGEFTLQPPRPQATKPDAASQSLVCSDNVELDSAKGSISFDVKSYVDAKGGIHRAGLDVEQRLAFYKSRPEYANINMFVANAEKLLAVLKACGARTALVDVSNGCRVRFYSAPTEPMTHIWKGECNAGFASGPGIYEAEQGGKTDIWEGAMVDGVFQGPVKVIRADGSTFDGTYENGSRKTGKLKYSSGTVYEGQFNAQGQPHGFGTVSYNSGSRYEGQFLDGKPHGVGVRHQKNGVVIEGEFKNGKANGVVKLNAPNAGVPYTYEGEMKDDQLHGRGKISWDNGNSFDGEFESNRLHGFGIFYQKDDKYRVRYVEGKVVNRIYIREGPDPWEQVANFLGIVNQGLQAAAPMMANNPGASSTNRLILGQSLLTQVAMAQSQAQSAVSNSAPSGSAGTPQTETLSPSASNETLAVVQQLLATTLPSQVSGSFLPAPLLGLNPGGGGRNSPSGVPGPGIQPTGLQGGGTGSACAAEEQRIMAKVNAMSAGSGQGICQSGKAMLSITNEVLPFYQRCPAQDPRGEMQQWARETQAQAQQMVRDTCVETPKRATVPTRSAPARTSPKSTQQPASARQEPSCPGCGLR
jgi:hypothetical protein